LYLPASQLAQVVEALATEYLPSMHNTQSSCPFANFPASQAVQVSVPDRMNPALQLQDHWLELPMAEVEWGGQDAHDIPFSEYVPTGH